MTPLLELKDIRRSYPAGDEQVEVLKGITLDIYAGEMVAIVGASGSGKSTLMNILGCLDKATSGTYRVAGQDVATLDADALARAVLQVLHSPDGGTAMGLAARARALQTHDAARNAADLLHIYESILQEEHP